MANLNEFKVWASGQISSASSANVYLTNGSNLTVGSIGWSPSSRTVQSDNIIYPLTQFTTFVSVPSEYPEWVEPESLPNGPLEWLRRRVGEICEAGSLELALV